MATQVTKYEKWQPRSSNMKSGNPGCTSLHNIDRGHGISHQLLLDFTSGYHVMGLT